jgi:RNA polymerase sigma factor (sigma-70 family)
MTKSTTQSALAALRQLMVDRYDELKTRLTERLGSAELASDALQDAWLRLARAEAVGTIRAPSSYLFRVLVNTALNRRRAERRHLNTLEIEALLDLADEAPGPAEVTEARSDLRVLETIMAELPPRQREILLAARLDGMPHKEIARRLGISLRLVEKELKQAQEYCLARRNRMMR